MGESSHSRTTGTNVDLIVKTNGSNSVFQAYTNIYEKLLEFSNKFQMKYQP